MNIPNLHDFPDRATRSTLQDWRNLRDTVRDAAPEIAARLVFERAELVDRSFLLEDWRGRQSDLLYRIPFRSGEGEVLVCLLLEHQSAPDARMPLRVLIYMVLYWERVERVLGPS
jgi:predicted transposase YdaD